MDGEASSARARGWRLQAPSFQTFQLIGLSIGVLWIAPRFYAALASSSVGLLADAVQHIIEVVFSVFVYLALRAAGRSSALLFPHGTGKFEAVASAVFSLSLILSGAAVFAAGAYRFVTPEVPEKAGLGITLLSVSLVINAALYITSAPLERDGAMIVKAWRKAYLLDVAMKAATILFVFAARSGGLLVYGDPLAAIIIGVSMLYLAIETLRHSIWELTDRALEEEVQLLIMKGLAARFDAFDDLLDIRTRRVGGIPIIEVVVGFELDRAWSRVFESCQELRASLEENVAGARVIIIPTAAGLPAGA